MTPASMGHYSRPLTPASPAHSSVSSYSAFDRTPSQKLPPVHLSTIGRGELLQWINTELDLHLKDLSEVDPLLLFTRPSPLSSF